MEYRIIRVVIKLNNKTNDYDGEDIIIKNNINFSLDQMRDIINNRENCIPQYIYKYREINPNEPIEDNKHIDALKNGKNYLAKPYSFNDPYDSAFSMDIEIFIESLIKTAERQAKEKILKIEFEKLGIDINKVNIDPICKDMNIDLSKAKPVFENNKQIFYEELINKIKFKISCFSETNKSILMWSHYASQHKGFCIEYDTSKIEDKIKKEIYPVFYHETFFPLIKTEKEINDKKFNSLIKYKDWRYEKEWRLLLNEDFVYLKPSKIYLGVKFDDDNLVLFKEIAHDQNCKLYKMNMDYSEYKLYETEI